MSSAEGIHRVIRRVCRWLLYLASATVFVLLLSLSLLIWCLIEAPIPLTLLTPYVETALPTSLAGLQLDVQDVVLAWQRQAKRIVLSARDVHLRGPQGIIDASLPTVDVTLNLPMLLRQRVVVLNKVYIHGANAHVQTAPQRTRNPSPTTRPALFPPPPTDVVQALETALAALERYPLFADFRTVHVFNSAVTLYRPSRPNPLRISELTLTLSRTADSLNTKLRFTTPLSDPAPKFQFNTTYDRASQQLSLKSEFENLRPSALATLDPTLAHLAGTTLPFKGAFDVVLIPQDTWPAISFDIRSGPGRMTLSSLYRKPLPIKELAATGDLNGTDQTLRLKTATVDIRASQPAPIRLHLQSATIGLSHPRRVEGDVSLTPFTMADLEKYWPTGMGQDPRQWITQNIPTGRIQKLNAHLVLGASKAKPSMLVVQDLTGSFHYEGLDVHYFRPLPPIQKIAGTSQFNRSGFHFEVAEGRLAKMALTGGEVDITGLDRPEQAIAIRTGLTGALQEAFPLLNHPRLNLVTGLGLPLETATGRFHVEPNITFSLSKAVRLEDVEINVQGMLQEVSLQEVILDQDLSNGQLYINLDQHHMLLEGQATWATMPLSFTWHTRFTQQPTDAWRDQMHVIMPRMGRDGRARLGYDLPGLIEGPMIAVIDSRTGWDERQTVDLQLDMRETALHLPWLNWHKPVGEPAKAVGRLQLAANRVTALTDLRLETSTLNASGNAQFDGAALEHVHLSHVTFGTNDLRDVVFRPLNPGIAMTLGDGFLDIAPFQHLLTRPVTISQRNGAQPIPRFPVQLDLPRLHRLQIAPDRYLRNVRAHLLWNGTDWHAIEASCQVPDELLQPHNGKPSANDAKTFDFRYLPDAPQPPIGLSRCRGSEWPAILRYLLVLSSLILPAS